MWGFGFALVGLACGFGFVGVVCGFRFDGFGVGFVGFTVGFTGGGGDRAVTRGTAATAPKAAGVKPLLRHDK